MAGSFEEKSFPKPIETIELCDKIKILPQEEQAGKSSNIIMEESVAIADKLLEYKCISTK